MTIALAPRRYAVSRVITFGPALALPLWGWSYLHEPFRWAGLGAMIAAGLLIWPALVVTAVFFLPAAVRGGLVPRSWRIAYRQKHGRQGARSAYISAGLRRVVYAADRYRCTSCGNGPYGRVPVAIQVDHCRPWAGGGLTTFLNCFTLCQPCNLIKLNYSRDRDGYEHYAGERTEKALASARKVLRRERWHRWSLFRLMRAAWALG